MLKAGIAQTNSSMNNSANNKTLQTDHRQSSDFWNEKMVDHLITQLGIARQKPFRPFNQNAEQIIIDNIGQTVQTKRQLPSYLLTLGVSSAFIEKSIIYQVNTIYSCWHSVLALIYPEYVLMDYEKKNLAVMKLRDTINNEFVNNQKLRNDIINHKLRLVHVENSIAQEKIQDEFLLRFFTIYFDVNIYLVTDDSCYIYHNGQTFNGGYINNINDTANTGATANQEKYNPYKASILLYRFSFGNLAPVLQEGRQNQILSTATDADFIIPLATRFLQRS